MTFAMRFVITNDVLYIYIYIGRICVVFFFHIIIFNSFGWDTVHEGRIDIL